MILPEDQAGIAAILSGASDDDLRTHIRDRRRIIRYHRNQKGDNRCWLDDFQVWAMIAGSPPMPVGINMETALQRCLQFWEHRGCLDIEYMRLASRMTYPKLVYDGDLYAVGRSILLEELRLMQKAIAHHRDIEKITGRARNFEDDQELYDILPEKMVADFRLPPKEEFLGRAKCQAGCPAFWESHQRCLQSVCNLGQWGPCS